MSGRPRALIIGAGALGMGFLAERMAADYDLCLADVPGRLLFLQELARRGGFSLNVCHPNGREVRDVHCRFSAAGVGSPAFAEALDAADLVLTAVGIRALPAVVSAITPGLGARQGRTWLLFCENGLSIASRYGAGLAGPVTVMDTVMSRMCRTQDAAGGRYMPLWHGHAVSLVVESFSDIPLDREACSGGPFSGSFHLVSREDFALWEDIKLFMHNGLHAFVAYHAFLEGTRRFPRVGRPLWDEARRIVEQELVPALLFHHPHAERSALAGYGADLLERFANPWFDDAIERGVRGAAEKLFPGERLLGGVAYIREAGVEPRGYASTIDAARRVAALQEGSWKNAG